MKKTLAVIAIILTIITTFVGCGKEPEDVRANLDISVDDLEVLLGDKMEEIIKEHDGDVYLASVDICGAASDQNLLVYYYKGEYKVFEIWTYYEGEIVRAGAIREDLMEYGYVSAFTSNTDNKLIFFCGGLNPTIKPRIVGKGIKREKASVEDEEQVTEIDWKYGKDYPGYGLY